MYIGNKYLNRAERLNLFTFVRDPFDRFISGFTQSVYSTFYGRKYYNFTYDSASKRMIRTMQVTNTTAIKAYIHDMLGNENPLPLILMGHFYPMAGK